MVGDPGSWPLGSYDPDRHRKVGRVYCYGLCHRGYDPLDSDNRWRVQRPKVVDGRPKCEDLMTRLLRVSRRSFVMRIGRTFPFDSHTPSIPPPPRARTSKLPFVVVRWVDRHGGLLKS